MPRYETDAPPQLVFVGDLLQVRLPLSRAVVPHRLPAGYAFDGDGQLGERVVHLG